MDRLRHMVALLSAEMLEEMLVTSLVLECWWEPMKLMAGTRVVQRYSVHPTGKLMVLMKAVEMC